MGTRLAAKLIVPGDVLLRTRRAPCGKSYRLRLKRPITLSPATSSALRPQAARSIQTSFATSDCGSKHRLHEPCRSGWDIGNPTLNGDQLERFRCRIPPLPEQRAIAHILGTLDDKIELNRRMNETLEAMARALFKSWFVDFDPVRAKAEGRDPGLPKPLADFFPDSFEDSELGEIPKGWNVGRSATSPSIRDGRTTRRRSSLPRRTSRLNTCR